MYRDSRNFLNMHIIEPDTEGLYDIPKIKGVDYFCDYKPGTEYVAFSDVLKEKADKKAADQAVHFFIDDYRFQRVWKNPLAYISMLRRYKYVCAPDFSMYTDMPMALQLYSHYRKHWCAALWEQNGIKVIPTICWSDGRSFEWCFDGEPENSVVAVASLGMRKNKEYIRKFNEGYAEMLAVLHPQLVVFFGKDVRTDENRKACPIERHKGWSEQLTERKAEILERKAERAKEKKIYAVL